MERKAGAAKEGEDGEEGRGNTRAASCVGMSREQQQRDETVKGKGAEGAGEKPSGKTPGGGANDGSSHPSSLRVPPAAAVVKIPVVTGSTIRRNPPVTLTGLDRMMAEMMKEPCMADLVGGGGVASTQSSQSSVVQPQQK